MIASLSLTSLVSGAGLSWAATRVPDHAGALERFGGTLLVAGLALLGAAMPFLG